MGFLNVDSLGLGTLHLTGLKNLEKIQKNEKKVYWILLGDKPTFTNKFIQIGQIFQR